MRSARPRRRLRTAGALSAVAVAMLAVAVVRHHADAAWLAMSERGEVLRKRCAAQPTTRTPLWGDARDGDAFAHYEKAATLLAPVAAALKGKQRLALHELSDDEFLAGIGTLRPKWQPALAELRIGSHCARARRSHTGGDTRTTDLSTYRDLTVAALLEARARRIESEPRDSVRWLLDAATLGLDCILEGVLVNQMVGTALLAIVAEQCSDDVLTSLPTGSLEQLAVGLAAIDERVPERLVMDHELLWMVDQLHRVPDQQGWGGMGTWQYGFSNRWMIADATLMAIDGYERMRTVEATSWAARQRAYASEAERLDTSANPMAAYMYSNVGAAERSVRRVLATLRMLRMAVDLHRDVEGPALRDPLGEGPLRVERHDDCLILCSSGHEDDDLLSRRVAR